MAQQMFDANGLSLQARMVWLHMRDEGGWYTSTELASELLPQDAHGGQAMGRVLYALCKRGHVVQRRLPREGFGVTHACTPPIGLGLEPAL